MHTKKHMAFAIIWFEQSEHGTGTSNFPSRPQPMALWWWLVTVTCLFGDFCAHEISGVWEIGRNLRERGECQRTAEICTGAHWTARGSRAGTIWLSMPSWHMIDTINDQTCRCLGCPPIQFGDWQWPIPSPTRPCEKTWLFLRPKNQAALQAKLFNSRETLFGKEAGIHTGSKL